MFLWFFVFLLSGLACGLRGFVGLGIPEVADEVVVDGEAAAALELEGEVAAGDLIAPPLVVDAPGVGHGSDGAEGAAIEDSAGCAVLIGLHGDRGGLVQGAKIPIADCRLSIVD